MKADLSIALPGVPLTSRPSLLAYADNLYLPLCRVPLPLDGGMPYAGIGCSLYSYTPNGFERWATVLDAGEGDVQLAQVGPEGVWLTLPTQVEQFSLARGDAGSFPLATTVPGTSAMSSGAALALTPPWLTTLFDGGLTQEALDAGATVLATDEYDTRWLWDPGSGRLGSLPSDGGLTWRTLVPGTATLATAEGAVLAGHRALLLSDGGAVLPDWTNGAGTPLELLDRPVMMGLGEAITFHRDCSSGAANCGEEEKEVWARGFSTDDGGELWRGLVAPAGAFGHVEEAALLAYPSAFDAVVQSSTDAGTFTYLMTFVQGAKAEVCPFRDGLSLGGALFSRGASGNAVWVLTNDGSGWKLEHYALGAISLQATGWPVSDGVSGQRRAR
jgi:hypothetical protein